MNEKKIIEHPFTCPINNKLKELEEKVQLIEKNNMEYNFFKKYPVAIVVGIGFCLILIYNIITK